MPALEVDGLTKRYRNGVLANDGISLSVRGGEVFGLLGPNGAGKTTLVRQVLALSRPTAGKIAVSGIDVVADPAAAKQRCSYAPQNQVSLENLTPRQVISLIGRIRGLRKAEAAAATEGLLARLDMGAWAKQRFGMLSGGLGRLTAFCAAAVAPGDVVVLDEPTNDVDPRRRRLLWDEVRSLADRGHAVVLVTHNVLEAERAADRLAIIDKGRLVGFGSPGELKRDVAGTFRLEVVLDATRLDGPEVIAPGFLHKPTRVGSRLVGEIAAPDAAKALGWVSSLRDEGTVEEFTLGPPTLEDVYLSATHG